MHEDLSALTEKALSRIRQKLLDLSKRNRLLNFKETARSIRIIDELPDQVFKTLVNDNKSMSLIPLPEQKEEDDRTTESSQLPLLESEKLSPEDFVVRAIIKLQEGEKKGIHIRKSGFSDAYKKYFNGEDPTHIIIDLAKQEKINIEKLQDGFMLYLNERIPEKNKSNETNPTSINTNYEVPVSDSDIPDKHRNLYLQTPFTAVPLERRCKRIHQESRTAIEETGSNFLHLAVGFLEWYEDDESSISYQAPLILIPVSIERSKIDTKTDCYKYILSYTEEDIETNISLAEKLSQDFDLILPEIDEVNIPEQYFEEVSKLVKYKKRFRVLREMVIGMFSFGKVLMYKDLDPERWPEHSKITEHHKIREVLGTKESDISYEQKIYGEEYDIDADSEAGNIPLIFDADSSQHSSIIDVLSGKDLVIEGPPGTGKSQTIANMICAALYKDKSVLFVAEKKAALEVVRRRLGWEGLGDFCLELHSYKTQKGKLHADLQKRIEQRFDNPAKLKYEIEDLNKERDKLRSYVILINSIDGACGETIHDIFWAAERWQSEMPGQSITFSVDKALSLSRHDIQNRVKILQEIEYIYKDIPQIAMETWRGFQPTGILPGDEEIIHETLLNLLQKTNNIITFLVNLTSEHNIPPKHTLNQLRELSNINTNALMDIPKDFDQTFAFDLINPKSGRVASNEIVLSQNCRIVFKLYDDIQKYTELVNSYSEVFFDNQDLSLEKIHEIKNSLETLKSLGYENLTIGTIDNLLAADNKTKQALANLADIADKISNLFIEKVSSISKYKAIQEVIKVIEDAPNDIDIYAHDALSTPFAAELFQSLKNELFDLKNEINGHFSFFQLNRIPGCKELTRLSSELNKFSGKKFSFLYSSLRKTRKAVREFLVNPKKVRSIETTEKLSSLSSIFEQAEKAKNNTEYQTVLGPLFKGIDTDWLRLEKHLNWAQLLRATTGSQELSKNIINNISLYRDRVSKLAPVINDALRIISKGLKELNLDIESTDEFNALIHTLEDINLRLVSAKNIFDMYIVNHDLNLIDIREAIDAFIDAEMLYSNIESDDRFNNLFKENFKATKTNIEKFRLIADWINSLYTQVNIPHELLLWLIQDNTKERLIVLSDYISSVKDYLNTYTDSINILEKYGKLDFDRFFGGSVKLNSMVEKYNQCIDQIGHLSLWSDYCRSVDKGNLMGLDKIIEAIEKNIIDPSTVVANYLAAVYKSMAKELIRKHPELATFTRAGYEIIRKRYSELDKKIMQYRSKQIAFKIDQRPIPVGNRVGYAKDYTEMSLIKRELNKRKRHIPIRQLVRRAGEALQAMKPCFMMSPLSVAQYLIPGKVSFDLVVMDEASQIRPEDALGAIARGSQTVIVGDPKQLPPMTFFERTNENIEDDEETMIENTESILDACLPISNPRRLRWHYRSDHESLIAFSNRQFYDDNLIVFPSPCSISHELGVRMHYIEGATYLKGKNHIEAKAIVNAVINHFKQSPKLSLGVATFNREQRDLIEDYLDKQQKQDQWLESVIKETEDTAEPFFIKNLENVQGDERDVIFISTTYGPDPDTRRVYQRFGPIGSDVGWRRLNVIFTRAKKRTEVFTSMQPDDIHVTDKTLKGVQELRNYLEYSKHGCFYDHGNISGREPGSDFEISVSRVLNGAGYKAIPQIGVTGFFIDIGVCHPYREGEFIIGIECDGATYHSAKSVRDRDRLRKEILEKKGWNIHRIWSTDWFKNREKEVQRLLKTIKDLIQKEESRLHVHEEDYKPIIEEHEVDIKDKEDLKDRLLKYHRDNIEKRFPDHLSGILRDEMLNALVQYKPTTMEEFRSMIPLRLREKTDRNQVQFLEDVFEIIEEYL